MMSTSRKFLRVELLLMSLISCSSSHALSDCQGCVPKHLRSKAYGLDVSSDYLAVAVQHVNGTLEPVAMAHPGLQYQSLMNRLLNESDISPYGHGADLPEHTLSRLQNQLVHAEVKILSEEITKIVSSVVSQGRNIQHYSIAILSFFTLSSEEHLLAALQHSSLPKPCSSLPVDWAVFHALNTTYCSRHFEFDCRPIDYNTKTMVFVEYSNSTLSGFLYQAWGGGYLDRAAYFVDPDLGKKTGQGNWEAVAQRVKALIEDNEDRLVFGRINRDTVEVVVFGQLAFDQTFHQALRDALYSYTKRPILPPTIQGSTILHPVFMAASGAARNAKSIIDRPRPENCNVEDGRCTRLREKVFQDSLLRQPEESEHPDELSEYGLLMGFSVPVQVFGNFLLQHVISILAKIVLIWRQYL